LPIRDSEGVEEGEGNKGKVTPTPSLGDQASGELIFWGCSDI